MVVIARKPQRARVRLQFEASTANIPVSHNIGLYVGVVNRYPLVNGVPVEILALLAFFYVEEGSRKVKESGIKSSQLFI